MGYREDVISFWHEYSHRSIFGVGKVKCFHGKEHECCIQLWQLKNGRLAIAIKSRSRLQCASSYYFEGKLQENNATLENWHMEVTEIRLSVDFLSRNSDGYHILGFIDGTVCVQDVVRVQPTCKRIASELTNISLDAMPDQFDLDELKVDIIHRGGAEYLVARSLRNSAILGELIISSKNPLSDREWDDVIDRLCYLLSLAQRSYVAMVSKFRFNEADGKYDYLMLCGVRGIQATKASRQFLISAENLPSYLKVGFTRLPQVYSLWNLGTALDHYLQAMDQESAWAIGTGLVVALECLVSAYASGNTNREYHFGEMENFEPLIPDVANQVMNQLEKNFPEATKRLRGNRDELSSWQSGFMNLNRRSFGRKIRSMLKELGIAQPKSDVLRKYIDLRNDLVHNGYPVSSKNFSDDFRAIMQMADFLEKTFLVILGYDGDVVGWDNYLV
jgi:hypothetical protein